MWRRRGGRCASAGGRSRSRGGCLSSWKWSPNQVVTCLVQSHCPFSNLDQESTRSSRWARCSSWSSLAMASNCACCFRVGGLPNLCRPSRKSMARICSARFSSQDGDVSMAHPPGAGSKSGVSVQQIGPRIDAENPQGQLFQLVKFGKGCQLCLLLPRWGLTELLPP